MNIPNNNDILRSNETSAFVNNAPSASVGSNGKSNLTTSAQAGKGAEILSNTSDILNLIITKNNVTLNVKESANPSSNSSMYETKSKAIDLNVPDATSSLRSTSSQTSNGAINEFISDQEGAYAHINFDINTNELSPVNITDDQFNKDKNKHTISNSNKHTHAMPNLKEVPNSKEMSNQNKISEKDKEKDKNKNFDKNKNR